jgi:hypothetical protein
MYWDLYLMVYLPMPEARGVWWSATSVCFYIYIYMYVSIYIYVCVCLCFLGF